MSKVDVHAQRWASEKWVSKEETQILRLGAPTPEEVVAQPLTSGSTELGPLGGRQTNKLPAVGVHGPMPSNGRPWTSRRQIWDQQRNFLSTENCVLPAVGAHQSRASRAERTKRKEVRGSSNGVHGLGFLCFFFPPPGRGWPCCGRWRHWQPPNPRWVWPRPRWRFPAWIAAGCPTRASGTSRPPLPHRVISAPRGSLKRASCGTCWSRKKTVKRPRTAGP